MQRIPDGSIDCIITDLPYGTTRNSWDCVIPFEPMWAQFKRVCKPNAPIVLFGSEPFSSMLRISNIKAFKYDWIWEKSKASNFLSSHSMPLKAHEIVSIFSFGTPKTYNPQYGLGEKYNKGCRKSMQETNYGYVNTEDYLIENKDGKRMPRSVVYFKTAESEGNVFHSTQKPVDLIRYFVRTYTNEGDTILDATIGSGTTAIAAIREKRHFIGFELNEEYYKKACERVKLEQSQPTLF